MNYHKLLSDLMRLGYKIKYTESTSSAIAWKINHRKINRICGANKRLINEDVVKSIRFDLNTTDVIKFGINQGISDKSGEPFVSITIFSPVKSIFLNKEREKFDVFFGGATKIKSIIFFSDGMYSQHPKIQRWISASVKDLKFLPQDIQKIIMKQLSDNNGYKDFINEHFYPPVKLENLSAYHNKRDYLEQIFKIELPSKANSLPFEELYALCCAAQYVAPENFPLMYNKQLSKQLSFSANEISYEPSFRDRKSIAVKYFKLYFSACAPSDGSILGDYIDMAFRLRRNIDVTARKSKLIKLHDELAEIEAKKALRGVKISIPETPMKYLTLPNEFTLIRTVKGLVHEGQINHNCVAGYAKKINEGRCVIYSADIYGNHLTIEIKHRKNRNNYSLYVNQCMKKYNKAPDDKTLDYVKKCVSEASPKAIKQYLKKTGS